VGGARSRRPVASIANVAKPLSDEILFEEHYRKVEAEARALKADDAPKKNLDASSAAAVSAALAIAPGLRRYREQIVQM
jgi:hypothetical protein